MMAVLHCSQWKIRASARVGGLIVLIYTLIKQEYAEMFGVVYTLAAVTDEPKTHGVAAAG